MKKSIKGAALGLLAVPMLVAGLVGFVPSVSTFAADDSIAGGASAAHNSTSQPSTLFGTSGSVFTEITNALLFIIGALAVLMLIYGGIRYVISAGNATAVTAAKNTILYAIVGIVVAVLAYAIVNFVLVKLGSN